MNTTLRRFSALIPPSPVARPSFIAGSRNRLWSRTYTTHCWFSLEPRFFTSSSFRSVLVAAARRRRVRSNCLFRRGEHTRAFYCRKWRFFAALFLLSSGVYDARRRPQPDRLSVYTRRRRRRDMLAGHVAAAYLIDCSPPRVECQRGVAINLSQASPPFDDRPVYNAPPN